MLLVLFLVFIIFKRVLVSILFFIFSLYINIVLYMSCVIPWMMKMWLIIHLFRVLVCNVYSYINTIHVYKYIMCVLFIVHYLQDISFFLLWYMFWTLLFYVFIISLPVVIIDLCVYYYAWHLFCFNVASCAV